MTEEDTAASAQYGSGGTPPAGGTPGTGRVPGPAGSPGTEQVPETGGTPGADSFPGTRGMPGASGMAGPDSVHRTGDARVDEAVARLGELADAPLEEHPVILGQIHDRLREVLGELGSSTPGPGPGPGPGSRGTP